MLFPFLTLKGNPNMPHIIGILLDLHALVSLLDLFLILFQSIELPVSLY